jgi:hypothetical protein
MHCSGRNKRALMHEAIYCGTTRVALPCPPRLLAVVESGLEAEHMATISDRALTIFTDACGVHNFTDVEQARIEVLAEQLNEILKASKQREKQQAERH